MAKIKARTKPFTFTVPIYANTTAKKVALMGVNWYNNAHYMAKSKCKRFYNELVREILSKEKEDIRYTGKVKIEYKVYLKRRNTDGGNVRAIIEKFVLDALVRVGVIKDDNATIVVKDSSEYLFDKDNPRCEVTIKKSR